MAENTTLISLGFAFAAAALYWLLRFAGRRAHFSAMDAVIMAALMTVAAAVMPWRQAEAERITHKNLLQNLYALRSQIELYKQDHGGNPPILYQGTLPQLLQVTDAAGYTGRKEAAGTAPHSNDSPQFFGPYFNGILPPNPISGNSQITATEEFPPVKASGNRGWLYDQSTGQIAIDLPDMLNQ
jgi:type II secretory pathway pseudopilin PulG